MLPVQGVTQREGLLMFGTDTTFFTIFGLWLVESADMDLCCVRPAVQSILNLYSTIVLSHQGLVKDECTHFPNFFMGVLSVGSVFTPKHFNISHLLFIQFLLLVVVHPSQQPCRD